MRLKTLSILATLMLLVQFLSIASDRTSDPGKTTSLCGLSDTLEEYRTSLREAKEILEGIKRFTTSAVEITARVSRFLGFRVILLLLAIILLSAGFSLLGLPRGRFTFLVSLATADALWFLWEKSFHPESFAWLGTMIKTNALILAPFAAYLFLSKLIPALARRILALIPSAGRWPLFRRYSRSREALARQMEETQRVYGSFQQSVTRDILSSKQNGQTLLSRESVRNIKNLQRALGEMADLSSGEEDSPS